MNSVEQFAAEMVRLEKEHLARVRAIDRTERWMKWLLIVVALWAVCGCAGFKTLVENWPTCSDPCFNQNRRCEHE